MLKPAGQLQLGAPGSHLTPGVFVTHKQAYRALWQESAVGFGSRVFERVDQRAAARLEYDVACRWQSRAVNDMCVRCGGHDKTQ